MKLDDYSALKELLLEFKMESEEAKRQIAFNLRYIKEAEAHLKTFTEAESEDFKVFSPRKMEIIHKEEIEKIRNEKSVYEEHNRELYRRKDNLDRRILKLKEILDRESSNLVLQKDRNEDIQNECIKDLNEYAARIQQSSGYIDRNPVQAKQDFMIIAKCLKETADKLRNNI